MFEICNDREKERSYVRNFVLDGLMRHQLAGFDVERRCNLCYWHMDIQTHDWSFIIAVALGDVLRKRCAYPAVRDHAALLNIGFIIDH